jgi:hypothetical protein
MNQSKEQKQRSVAVKNYEKVRKQFEKKTAIPTWNAQKRCDFDPRRLDVCFQCGLKKTTKEERAGGWTKRGSEFMRTVTCINENGFITKHFDPRVIYDYVRETDGRKIVCFSWIDASSGWNHWKYDAENPTDKKWLDRIAEIHHWDCKAMREEEL